jgi:hypothetical protein
MRDRSPTRPLLRRGLGVAASALLVAGSLFVPAAALASGASPKANDDNFPATEDTPKVLQASDLLANDTDPENDTLTVTQVENPLSGTVGMVGTTITFTPDANECSPDELFRFEYEISDGTNGAEHAFVTLNVACVNDNPQAEDDVAHGHQEDNLVLDGSEITDNDFDVDEDALTVSAVSNPTHGTVNLVGQTITFDPDGIACDPVDGGFDYTVSDGHGGSDVGHVIVELACSGTNHTPVATNDHADGTEDTNLVLSEASLILNDNDADAGDTLNITQVENFVGGHAVFLNNNVTFTPTKNLCGESVARFEYTLSDGTDTDFGVVTIDLTCVNDAPVTVADTAIVAENSPAKDYDVLANDSDPEGDAMTLTNATVSAAQGTASVIAGKVRFQPKAGFHGQAVVTYTVTDGDDDSTGTLTVTVGKDVNPPVVATPIVGFGSGRVDNTAPLKVSWSAVDVGVGVAKFKAQAKVGDGKWQTIAKGKVNSDTDDYPFKKNLQFRVRAWDKEGNKSAWKVSAVRKLVADRNTSGDVSYTGSWTKVTGSDPYSFTTRKGNSARMSFSGRQVIYVAPTNSKSGVVKVLVDGAQDAKVDLQSNKTKNGKIIARISVSPAGSHTIRIVNDEKGARTNFALFVVLK